jgi:hypothetical protein
MCWFDAVKDTRKREARTHYSTRRTAPGARGSMATPVLVYSHHLCRCMCYRMLTLRLFSVDAGTGTRQRFGAIDPEKYSLWGLKLINKQRVIMLRLHQLRPFN